MKPKHFDLVIEILFLALVFLVPTYFDRRLGIVFSGSKTALMRILTILILTVWSLKAFLVGHKFIRTKLDWLVLSFFLLWTTATINSIHVYSSFQGFYGRYEGWTTALVWMVLFFVATNFIRTREQFSRVIMAVFLAGVYMSTYGVMQRFRLDPFAWGGVQTQKRAIGTIGQPNFLAAYVLMAFVLGLYLYLREEKLLPERLSREKPRGSTGKKGKEKKRKTKESWLVSQGMLFDVFLIVGLTLIYTCILFTQSRGGLLGFVGGVSLFCIFAGRDIFIRHWKKIALLFVFVCMVSLVTLATPGYSPLRRFQVAEHRVQEVVVKAGEIKLGGAAGSRKETWKSAFKMIVDRPFFGVGPEVIKMIFPRYETSRFRFYEGFHVKQDRCHNEIFDVSVTKGIFLLIVYSWLLVSFATFIWKGRKVFGEHRLFLACLGGAWGSYVLQNQYSFGVVAISTLYWVIMGMGSGLTARITEYPDNREPGTLRISHWSMGGSIFVVGLATFLCYLPTIPYRADIHYKSGNVYTQMKRFFVAAAEYRRAIEVNPFEPGHYTRLALAYLNQGNKDKEKRLQWLEKSERTFKRAIEVDPYNADNYTILGKVHLLYYQEGEKKALEKAISYSEKALIIDPYYAEVHHNLGMIYERQGKHKKAASHYQEAFAINPSLTESMVGAANAYIRMGTPNAIFKSLKEVIAEYQDNPAWAANIYENMGALYQKRGLTKEAEKVFGEMVEMGTASNKARLNLALIYVGKNELDKAEEMFAQVLRADSKNVDALNGLGFCYGKKGQIFAAKEKFEQVLLIDPSNEYARKMLKAITGR